MPMNRGKEGPHLLSEPVSPRPPEQGHVSFSSPQSLGARLPLVLLSDSLYPQAPHPYCQHGQRILMVLLKTQESPRLHSAMQSLEHWLGDRRIRF